MGAPESEVEYRRRILDALESRSGDEVRVYLLAQNPSGNPVKVQANADGDLLGQLEVSDVQIGAVELEDPDSGDRAVIRTPTNVSESELALAVYAAIMGETGDAAETDHTAAATHAARLAALVQILQDAGLHQAGIYGSDDGGTTMRLVATNSSGEPVLDQPISIDDNGAVVTVGGIQSDGSTENHILVDSDGHVQVDVVGSLPAGNANIGSVDIASAIPGGNNNIGSVDAGLFTEDSAGNRELLESNQELGGLINETGVTADQQAAAQTAKGLRGVILRVNLSNVSGTPSYSPGIEVQAPDGTWTRLFTASTALSSAGDFLYAIYPGASGSSGDLQESQGTPISRTWRPVVDADSADGSNQADVLVEAMPVM